MSNYPTSLDTFVNPTTANTLDNPPHATQHADINDAVEAIEAKLGIGTSTASGASTGYALVASTGGTTAWNQVGYEGITSGTATAGEVLTAQGGGTAIWQAPVDNSGLVHINTTNFSAVASQSVNDVFTSTYKTYKVIIDHTVSTNLSTSLRLRVGGSDNSTSNYGYQYVTASATSVSGARATGQTSFAMGGVANRTSYSFLIFNPAESLRTGLQLFAGDDYAGTGLRIALYNFGFNADTVFDGFTLIASTGNMTGRIQVYGLKE